MEDESDESLVTYMGFHEEEPESAESAVGELFKRHSRKMTAWCRATFLLYRQNHEDLVKRTFEKALKGAAAFVSKLVKQNDDAAKTRHIKFWLYCILKRTCIDAQRSEKFERAHRSDVDVETVQMVALDPDDTGPGDVPTELRIELVHNFITDQKTNDQAILYNTMQYYDCATGQAIIPKSVLKALCEELEMTTVSLRTKRCRLLQSLHEYIVENE
jgi:DNA-directed RNA polymerase specialized sigma24 family protein